MDELSYGYVEATQYWYENLAEKFMLSGYEVSKNDQCIFIKYQDKNVVFCGTIVDDCFFVCNRNQEWTENQIDMLKRKFKNINVEVGDELGLIGMQIKMD